MTSNPAPDPSRVSRASRLTPRLFLFVVLPLTALLVVIAFGSLTLHSRAMRSLVAEREERTVHAAADSVSEQLLHRGDLVRALAMHALDAPTPGAALADFDFLSDTFEGGVAIVAPDGWLTALGTATEAWADRPVEDVVARARSAGGIQFTEAFNDPALQAPAVLVAFAAPGGPAAVGVFLPGGLAARILADAFTPESQVDAWIVDPGMHTLYRLGTTGDPSSLAGHPGVADALRGESGVLFATFAGEEHVIAYRPIPPVGWALVIEEPWEAVDNPLLRQTQAAPLILLPAFAFAVLALVFGVRQVVQPLQALEARAASLGRGDFEAIERPVGGIGEIKSLQQTLVRMAQQVRSYQDSIRRYIGALTRGQEDERRRLARELHDDTVQALIALDQRTQLAQMAVKRGSPDAADRLAELRQWTVSLLDGVRRVIRALRPIYLEDLGLPSALEMLAHDVESSAGLQVHLEMNGPPVRLSPDREIAVYRIVQEALSNVARHAQARSAQLVVTFEPDRILVTVRDDGVGFQAPDRLNDLAASSHYGLLGMQERAELIGARLVLESAPRAGTTVRLDLPL